MIQRWDWMYIRAKRSDSWNKKSGTLHREMQICQVCYYKVFVYSVSVACSVFLSFGPSRAEKRVLCSGDFLGGFRLVCNRYRPRGYTANMMRSMHPLCGICQEKWQLKQEDANLPSLCLYLLFHSGERKDVLGNLPNTFRFVWVNNATVLCSICQVIRQVKIRSCQARSTKPGTHSMQSVKAHPCMGFHPRSN